MKTLPANPSELLRLAVCDLEKIEGDGRYQICMAQWHFPLENGPCLVSLAGAVMGKTLGTANRTAGYPPSFGAKNEARLRALEEMARGRFAEAFACMGIPREPPIERLAIPPYREDPEQFKADLLTAADYFEMAGL